MNRILPHLAVALLGTAPLGLTARPAAAPIAPVQIVQASSACDDACCCEDACPAPACDEPCATACE